MCLSVVAILRQVSIRELAISRSRLGMTRPAGPEMLLPARTSPVELKIGAAMARLDALQIRNPYRCKGKNVSYPYSFFLQEINHVPFFLVLVL